MLLNKVRIIVRKKIKFKNDYLRMNNFIPMLFCIVNVYQFV